MNIHRVVWQRFDVNSYILEFDNNAVIIDCNINTLPYIIEKNISPSHIFLTHEHFDHIAGLGEIKNKYKDVTIIATKKASIFFPDINNNMSLFFDGHTIAEERADIEIEQNTTFELYNKKILCYLTPGHTYGSMVISIDNMLFTGDTILNNVKTPKNTPNSSKELLIESVEFIDENFDDNVVIYPGHNDCLLKSQWNKDITLGKKLKS